MERGRGNWLWWATAALVIGFAALHLLRGSGPAEPAPVSVARAPSAAPHPGSEKVFVHVAGRVRRPGLYRLAQGARVAAAIGRAGGPAARADLTRVNLAARVEDGQQIVVPRMSAAPAASSASSAQGAKISLGNATVEQLDGLDGIGPTLAKRIIEYREAHGGFRSLGQLRDVEGIGEKRFEALRKALGP